MRSERATCLATECETDRKTERNLTPCERSRRRPARRDLEQWRRKSHAAVAAQNSNSTWGQGEVSEEEEEEEEEEEYNGD